MLGHSFMHVVVMWAALHAVQIVLALLAVRRLRGRWAWAALILSAAAAFLGPLSVLVMGLYEEFVGWGPNLLTMQLFGVFVGEIFAGLTTWFSLPAALMSLALDPVFWRRPLSFGSRLAGLAAILLVLSFDA
jgi:hypothetical protein